MEYGREFRAMVHRELVELVRVSRLRIDVRIGASDEPEDRRNVPLRTKRPEILARGRGPGRPDTCGAEVPAERLHHALGGFLIVHVKRIVVDRRDLWLPVRTRCGRFGVDD